MARQPAQSGAVDYPLSKEFTSLAIGGNTRRKEKEISIFFIGPCANCKYVARDLKGGTCMNPIPARFWCGRG